MKCPFCKHPDSRVIDSRTADDGLSVRRRRQCPDCAGRFSTVETASLTVIKRGGAIELFSRDKVISGVRKACQGRPVSEADLSKLAADVEDAVRATGVAQVEAGEVGRAVLPFLRKLDQIAYLRFASVYLDFGSLAAFEAEIEQLKREADSATQKPGSRR